MSPARTVSGMATVVLGPRPPELEAVLERRRALGQDRHDEVWEGSYVMAPYAHSDHGILQAQLALVLAPRAAALGLVASVGFNLGHADDFRVPDGGLTRGRPRTLYVPTAELVVEVLSPDDQTYAKLDFYTARGVRELLVVDGETRTVRCFALQDGQVEVPRSAVLDVGTTELQDAIDWPGAD